MRNHCTNVNARTTERQRVSATKTIERFAMSGGFITLHVFFALQKMFSELTALIHIPRKQSHRGTRTRSKALVNLCAHHWTTRARWIWAKVQCERVRLPLCSELQSQKSTEVGFEPGPLRLHTRALTNGLY